MKVLNRYFTRDARALKIQFEIRDLQKQIRRLHRKQRKIFTLLHQDDAEVRHMFNNGVFDNYGKMTWKYFNKLYNL